MTPVHGGVYTGRFSGVGDGALFASLLQPSPIGVGNACGKPAPNEVDTRPGPRYTLRLPERPTAGQGGLLFDNRMTCQNPFG